MSTNEASRERTYTWEDPMLSAECARTMSGIDYLKGFLDGRFPMAPIAKTLDFTIADADEGRAVFTCTPSEFHYNPIGVVHGGLISTLLDSALGCAIQSMLPAGTMYTTIELHVNMVRPLTHDTGEIRCEANVVHISRRMGTAEAKVIDLNGKLYGHGTTTCMIFSPDGE